MDASADEPDWIPPLIPNAERRVSGDHEFLTACHAIIAGYVNSRHLKLGTPLLTHSAKFGLIWRVDYEDPRASPSGLINRIVCWKLPNGEMAKQFAHFQKIPALHE